MFDTLMIVDCIWW